MSVLEVNIIWQACRAQFNNKERLQKPLFILVLLTFRSLL